MINYGLENRVAIITGANNPWGIGVTTALAFAREGAKLVLVYKKVERPFDPAKTGANGVDRYYSANAGDAAAVESKLQEMGADYLILESDISNKTAYWKCYRGHEWQAPIDSRNRGNGCLYCSGRCAVKGENDLQTVNPKLASEWNYDKNNGLTPMDVTSNSNKKV